MFRAVLCVLLTAAAVTTAAAPAAGGPASFWEMTGFDDFAGGSLDGVSIEDTGTLVLGPPFEVVELPDADYAWRAAFGPDGAVYVTTGSPGRLVRSEGGEVVVLHEEATADLPALAVSPAGDVFVGTAPGGTVLRIDERGGVEVFFESEEGYIWDLAWSEDHGLIVGTGESAAVYAVDGRGGSELLLQSEDASVVSVAARGGRVLAGTSPGGMLLEATPGVSPSVLYDTRYDEVTGIVIDGDMVTFAASTIVFEEALGEDSTFDQGFGEGAVFRLPTGGPVEEIWQSLDAPLTAFGRGPDGSVWAGAGTGGSIHAFLRGGRVRLVGRLGSEEILGIDASGDGTLIAGGLPAAVWLSGGSTRERGVYRSDVLDAGQGARWGTLSWRASTEGGSVVTFFTRSGNTAAPDATWSPWVGVRGEGQGAIESPGARFLQWKAELVRGRRGVSPRLFDVRASFLGGNSPPILESVTVFEPADAVAAGNGGYGATSAHQSFPSGLEVTYNLEGDGDAGQIMHGIATVLRTAEWRAYDPDGDRLRFELSIRSEAEERWKTMVTDLDRTAHTWDTRSMDDGFYRLRVEASDAPDRAGDARATSIESDPFLVDNGRPSVDELSIALEEGRLEVSGLAADALSPIVAVDVAVDYGAWEGAAPDDRLFDSGEERFSASLDHPGAGEHVVAVRAIDRHGNMAVARDVVRLTD